MEIEWDEFYVMIIGLVCSGTSQPETMVFTMKYMGGGCPDNFPVNQFDDMGICSGTVMGYHGNFLGCKLNIMRISWAYHGNIIKMTPLTSSVYGSCFTLLYHILYVSIGCVSMR